VSLRCKALLGGVCVPALQRTLGGGLRPLGGNGKNGGSRSKLDWENPAFYDECFLLQAVPQKPPTLQVLRCTLATVSYGVATITVMDDH